MNEKLKDKPFMSEKLRELAQSPGIRLAVYVAATALTIGLLSWIFPWLQPLILGGPAGVGGAPDFGAPIPLESANGTFAQQITQTVFIAVLTLLGALVFMAPLVWMYTVMLRQEGYDKSFVRMLVTLPVVVAGVVQVVEGDLALAFALAGIVAAVRFRTTVNDLQDAVFAFVGIGIGLATGTGAFALAAAISGVVCFLFYVAWRFNIGDVEPQLEVIATGGSLAEALVPGETQKAVGLGDKEAIVPVRAQDLESLSGHIEKLAAYVRADALRKRKKYRELLLVYTTDPTEARKWVKNALDEHASRWVEVDHIHMNGDRNVEVIEYLVRLKKDVQIGRMVDQLSSKAGDPVLAVELKPVTGLRKQLT